MVTGEFFRVAENLFRIRRWPPAWNAITDWVTESPRTDPYKLERIPQIWATIMVELLII